MYKGLRKFKVTNQNANAVVNIEIDFRKADTMPRINMMVKNRIDGDDLINENDGDVVATFLNELARSAIQISLRGFSIIGVIKQLESDRGFYLMDGTHGFKLISIKSQLDLSPKSMELNMVG